MGYEVGVDEGIRGGDCTMTSTSICCPLCGEPFSLTYNSKSKVVTTIQKCVHLHNVIVTDRGALVTFTASTTLKIEVD